MPLFTYAFATQQSYTEEGFRIHMRWLIPRFKDPRYIRVSDGRPLFIMHSTFEVDDNFAGGSKRMIEIFRDEVCMSHEYPKQHAHLYTRTRARMNTLHNHTDILTTVCGISVVNINQ